MHNWRLLLLAFVAVFQPIASFTESSGVDGRQRCGYRTTSLLRDPVNFHGTYRFTKPAVGDRRLNKREDVRGNRHNDVRGEFRTALQSRIADAIEKSDRILPSLSRFSRSEYRLTGNAAVSSRESRDERKTVIRRARQSTLDSRLSVSDHGRQIPSTRSSARLPMERRQISQRNQEAQRDRDIRNTYIVSDRVRADVTNSIRNTRRIARERTPRMDMRRSGTRMQLERTASREMNRATEFRGSLMTGARVNRANDNIDYRSIRKDISHSLDRDERRSTRSRRTLDKERLQRTRRSRDSILRERVIDEQRMVRDLSARIRELQSDLSVENRRDFSSWEARVRGNRVVEDQRETRNNERDSRLAKAIRFTENRVSQNSERGSSTETRRGENVIRNMEREYRTTKNRRNVRTQDREIQRNVRNTVKDSRAIRLDRERATEVRGEARYANRQFYSLSTDRNAVRRSSERVNRLLTERDAQNQRSSRNLELQRDAGERAIREVRRESPLGRNIRFNFGNTRSVENRRSKEVRRETRNAESRRITGEHENRRNNERLSQSFDRLLDSRKDTRENNRDARILRQKRSSEIRETERISRARDMSEENRRSVERQSRITKEERNLTNRVIRTAEITNSRSTRRESSAGNRRDIRKVDIETRRVARNTEKDFQAVRAKESRGVRARNSLSLDGKSFRATERLSMRDISVKSRRSRSLEESHRVSENNMDLERRVASSRFITEMTKKREFLSATGKNENETSKMNWQYLFYVLQGVYLCGILAQMMNDKRSDMKTRTLAWWSAPQHLIKVD